MSVCDQFHLPAKFKKTKTKKETTAPAQDTTVKKIMIDFEGIESRVVAIPTDPGNYSNLSVAEDNVYYLRTAFGPPI